MRLMLWRGRPHPTPRIAALVVDNRQWLCLVLLVLHLALCSFFLLSGQGARHLGRYGTEGQFCCLFVAALVVFSGRRQRHVSGFPCDDLSSCVPFCGRHDQDALVGMDKKDSSAVQRHTCGDTVTALVIFLGNGMVNGWFCLCPHRVAFLSVVVRPKMLRHHGRYDPEGLFCWVLLVTILLPFCVNMLKMLGILVGMDLKDNTSLVVFFGNGMCKAGLLVTLHLALCSLDCRPSSSTMVAVHGWFCL